MLQFIMLELELNRNIAALLTLNCVRIFSLTSVDSAARIFEVICGQVLAFFLFLSPPPLHFSPLSHWSDVVTPSPLPLHFASVQHRFLISSVIIVTLCLNKKKNPTHHTLL